MLKFIVTIEYHDDSTTKITHPSWPDAKLILDCWLNSDAQARLVRRVTIVPAFFP